MSTTASVVTIDDAIKIGYLEEKSVVLKPSPRGGKMVNDPKHIAYFQMDGSTTGFCLPRNSRGDLVSVFKDSKERMFFEAILGLDLNESKPGNYFEKLVVSVVKDPALMYIGYRFNMADPMDNLRYRVVEKSPSVAPSWDKRLDRVEYRWALVDESKINEEAEKLFDSQQELWMYIGKIGDDTPKLRKILMVYYSTIGSSQKIPIDVKKQTLMQDINTISGDKDKRENFLNIVNDGLFQSKLFALQALEVGAIKKDGVNTYMFSGDEITYTFNEMAAKINDLKEIDDDLYYKIQDQIKKGNN